VSQPLGSAEPRWDAVAVHPADDVATALRALPAGAVARVQAGDEMRPCPVVEAIAFGHKFALRDLVAGAPVRKYGEVIGELTAPVARGAHVHVHNLVSRRARRGAPP
jgi:altronate dehydratase small subunit